MLIVFFCFKQKTAYEMRISDWSSDVCSSDLQDRLEGITFGTFDLSAEVLKAIADGKMAFAIDQQQYLQGYLPIVLLTQYAKYGVMPASTILTGPGFVTPENAQQVIELSAQGYR